MIKKFILKRFGKFMDDAFEMKPVTIFVGRNEGGKTTLFDAMFDQLCSPKANVTEGKRLKERYGDKRDARLEFDSEPWEFDIDEFTNIYAVRAGVAEIGFKKNANWAEAIRNAIFSGGLDPAKIMKELKDQASDKATFVHVKQLKHAEKKLVEAENRKQSLLVERDSLLSQEVQVKEGDQKLKEIETEIKQKQAALLDRRRQLDMQEKIRERKAINRFLSDLLSQKELEEKLRALNVYAKNDTHEIIDLRKRSEQLQQSASELKGQIATVERQLAQYDQEIAKSELALDQQKQYLDLAERLRSELNTGRALQKEVVRPHFHKLLLSTSILLAAAAIAGFAGVLNLGSSVPTWIPGTVLLVAAAVILKLSYKKTTEITYDNQSDQRLLEVVRDKWRNATNTSLQSLTIDGAAEELMRHVSECERTQQRVLDLKNSKRNSDSELKEKHKESEKLRAERDVVDHEISSWFSSHGVADLSEYNRKRHDFEDAQAALKKISESNEHQIKNSGEKDADAFKAALLTKLAILDKEITMEELQAEKLQRLRNEAVALESDLIDLDGGQKRQLELVSKGIGRLQARMGTLPAEFYACQQEIDELSRKIEQIRIDMKAAEYALQIFEEIRHEQSDIFVKLGAEISTFYSQMFPQERKIAITAFEAKEIQIEDNGGEKRVIEHVSTATKDAFYLASRLAFALKTRGNEPGLIVLDEPFASFDRERQGHATRFLKSFQEQNGWQVVVFTKDEAFADLARESFQASNDVAVHHLAV